MWLLLVTSFGEQRAHRRLTRKCQNTFANSKRIEEEDLVDFSLKLGFSAADVCILEHRGTADIMGVCWRPWYGRSGL